MLTDAKATETVCLSAHSPGVRFSDKHCKAELKIARAKHLPFGAACGKCASRIPWNGVPGLWCRHDPILLPNQSTDSSLCGLALHSSTLNKKKTPLLRHPCAWKLCHFIHKLARAYAACETCSLQVAWPQLSFLLTGFLLCFAWRRILKLRQDPVQVL